MAKLMGTFAGLERFDLERPEHGYGVDPVVPKDFEVVHACVFPEEPWTGVWADVADATVPIFAQPAHFMEAACGRHVRVYLPRPFDSEEPKACQRCKDQIGVKG